MKKIGVTLGFLMICTVYLAADHPADYEKYWHQWRGPYMTGVSPDGDPPLEWSENRNIKWKIEIPGRGHATPIIWGERIFVLTAAPLSEEVKPAEQGEGQQGRGRGMPARKTTQKHQFLVLCLNRADGKILWRKTVKEEVPQEATHDLGSWASHSPVTDGEHVYAYFGSRGIYCLDFEGNLKWERDFGQMSKHMQFGEGSSPALYGDKLIIVWDHEGDSFIYALDKKTGKDVWKIPRDEGTSWATPVVVEVNGRAQVITSATNRVRSYNLDSGDLIWECEGMTRNVIPVPLVKDGVAYLTSGFRGNALFAINLEAAKGDITGTDAVIWRYEGKETPYTPSGLLFEGKLYLLRSNNGILSCFDIKTGREIYSGQRLQGMGNLYTSPVGAKNRIYILGQKGTMFIIQHGSEFKILAKNVLEDSFHASPVIIGDELYLRGFQYLYRIEQQ